MRRLGALALLVAVLAGCSRSGASPSDEAAAAPTTAAATTVATTSTAPPSTTEAASARPALPQPPPAPADARGVAVALTHVDRVLRAHPPSRAEFAEAAHRHQVIFRTWARHPEWDDEVWHRLPDELEPTARGFLAGRRAFAAMHIGQTITRMPAWRIVEPAPAPELRTYYEEAAARFGVPWPVLAAINLVETGMGRIRGVSVAGALGPMQFMPSTWEAFGEGDVHNPRDAIMAAARYLDASGADRDLARAVWHYNHSNRYVEGVLAFADVIARDSLAYDVIYHWQVYYATPFGDLWLPVGWQASEPEPIEQYLTRHARS